MWEAWEAARGEMRVRALRRTGTVPELWWRLGCAENELPVFRQGVPIGTGAENLDRPPLFVHLVRGITSGGDGGGQGFRGSQHPTKPPRGCPTTCAEWWEST